MTDLNSRCWFFFLFLFCEIIKIDDDMYIWFRFDILWQVKFWVQGTKSSIWLLEKFLEDMHYRSVIHLVYSCKLFISFFLARLAFNIVATDITAVIKKFIWMKEQISDILFFNGKWSYLRSRHLVLWSLGTLTGQQRLYDTRLIT
jgi:hypothetical protein